MAKERQRAREWPNKAAAVADHAVDGLAAIALEAASMSGQAKAISGLAEGCAVTIREGDLESVQHMLLSVRELAVAQQQLCVNIRERATAHRSSLAAARRGEY